MVPWGTRPQTVTEVDVSAPAPGAAEISKVAVENGMTRLRDDGWLKVRRGLTSIEEVLRVIATTRPGGRARRCC